MQLGLEEQKMLSSTISPSSPTSPHTTETSHDEINTRKERDNSQGIKRARRCFSTQYSGCEQRGSRAASCAGSSGRATEAVLGGRDNGSGRRDRHARRATSAEEKDELQKRRESSKS
jgi:hypothetical protein